MIESRSPCLAGHGDRTARYAVKLGQAAGFAERELTDLYFASLLHDIGLLGIPSGILEKDGPLSHEEYALVQSHPRIGAELLEPIPFLRTAALWIALHHERWDGAGYPYGLRGEWIPLGARILAVADTYDRLVTEDWTGQQLEPEIALRLLNVMAGSQLDPNLVSVFLDLIAAADDASGSAAVSGLSDTVHGPVCGALLNAES
jgi:HD-GYP domain-containing protein (c-di-GMP phosphodiesterase class II)